MIRVAEEKKHAARSRDGTSGGKWTGIPEQSRVHRHLEPPGKSSTEVFYPIWEKRAPLEEIKKEGGIRVPGRKENLK